MLGARQRRVIQRDIDVRLIAQPHRIRLEPEHRNIGRHGLSGRE